MKTIKSLMLFAAAAMAFAGCSKDDGTTNDMGVKVRFTAGTDQTRTAFGEPNGTTYPTLWQEGDKIALRLNTSTSKIDCPVTPTNGGANSTFDATLTDDNSGSYTIQALSPASAFVSALASGHWRVTVPATQTPTAASCDPAAQILFAASETTTMPTSVSLRFKHATAYGKFSFKNLNLGSATVNSITLTTEPAITGRFEYDFSTNALSENSSSNTLTIETSSTENIWFACAPADLSNTTLKVVLSTDQGTLTKEVSMPAGRAFQAGRIATFDLDMTGIELAAPVRYELLAAASDLEDGDQVIIAAKNGDVAISTTQNTNNRAQAAVTKDGTYIVSPSDGVEIFDVEVVGDLFAFKATRTAGYIYAASSGSNWMRTESTLDDNGKWKLTVDADGTASLVAQGTNTRNQLRYNSGSKIFACYGSGQQPIALYVKKGSSGPRFSVTATETELASTATSASVAIGGNVAWTATVTGDATFENGTKTLTGTGSTTAVISFAANTAVDAKTYTVEVSTTADVATKSYSIVFTQAGLPADAKYYVLTDHVTAGEKYLIVTDVNNVYKAMTPLATGKYGYLSTIDVTVSDGKILSNDETNALAFTIEAAGENAYYLVDATGKYYYQQGTYNSFNVSDNNTDTSIVYTWSIAFANGLAEIKHTGVSKTIQYDSQYSTYGSYTDVTRTLPALYVLEK